MLRVVAYLRVSTERQAEEGLGLAVQEDAISVWVKTRGHSLVDITKDEGISGSNGIETRLGLADALQMLRDKKARGLVVYRLDRLARDLVLQEQLLAEIRKMGCQVFSTSQAEAGYLEDDPKDPSRKLIRQVLGAVSEYERAMVVLRLSAGRQRKASEGGFAYGSPPFGYRSEEGRLVPDPEEQKVIARMAELHLRGRPYLQIAERLNAEGLKPRRSDRWHPQTVSRVLQRLNLVAS